MLAHLGALLAYLEGYVGPAWGAMFAPILRPCWPILGAMLPHLEAMLADLEAYVGPF